MDGWMEERKGRQGWYIRSMDGMSIEHAQPRQVLLFKKFFVSTNDSVFSIFGTS